jgi:resuscitation-promoting factor RpfA
MHSTREFLIRFVIVASCIFLAIPAAASAGPAPSRVNWDAIARCESSGRWHYNGPSGYDGGLQFLPSTWRSVVRASGFRFPRYAYQATRSQQITAAQYLIGPMRANPWRQWPYCWRFR